MDGLSELIAAFMTLLYGLMWRYGVFSGQHDRWYRRILFDEAVFPGLDVGLAQRTDKTCFRICILMSTLTAINGLLILLVPKIPNIGMIFIVIAFPGTMIFRTIYIMINRSRKIKGNGIS